VAIYLPYHKEKVDPDAWLRRVVEQQFDPQGGAPFWLEYQAEAGIDFRRRVRTMADLALFGHPSEVTARLSRALRGRPTEDLVPRSCLRCGRGRLMTGASGGSTGDEQVVVYDMDRTWPRILAFDLFFYDLHQVPGGLNVLYAGPTGAHTVGKVLPLVTAARDGLVYSIDLDPRFVKRAARQRRRDVVDMYLGHLRAQLEPIVRSRRVGVLYTTPPLLVEFADLWRRIEGLELVIFSGAPLPGDDYKYLEEELFAGTRLMGIYGNSLFAAGYQVPRRDDSFCQDYYFMYPEFITEVVDPQDYTRAVAPGERGLVLFRRLTPELFIPAYVDRDTATRIGPCPESGLEHDGVRDPSPTSAQRRGIVDGEEVSWQDGVY